MKVLLDTSVLVAALVEPHPEHLRALPWLTKSKSKSNDGVRLSGGNKKSGLRESTNRNNDPDMAPCRRYLPDFVWTEVKTSGKTTEAYKPALVPLHSYGMINFGESPALILLTLPCQCAKIFPPGEGDSLKSHRMPQAMVPGSPRLTLAPEG